VVIDSSGQAYRPSSVKWADQKTDFLFSELSVPRRPAWDENTTAEELQVLEQESFLKWRRAIALKEEELVRSATSAAATPFEKNLEVWRQLWRVMERSSCLLQLVDARNPLFYLSDDLKTYAESLGKPMMVLINKSDYLSQKQRQTWRDYLTTRGWDPVFFSAVLEQQKLDEDAYKRRKREEAEMLLSELESPEQPVDDDDEGDLDEDDQEESTDEEGLVENDGDKHEYTFEPESSDGRGVDVPLTRKQLLETMLAFARQHGCKPDERYGNRIQFGMVGFPNVGKSSVINVLMGSNKHQHGVVRAAVAAQPGKTKHFQTLLLSDTDDMMLCDCPGLVFPSFVSNTADLIAAGVYPIAQMRDHWQVTNLICQRIPREIINAAYGIHLPVPAEYELRERGLTEVPPPTGEELLTTFCIARSIFASSSGIPDFTRAARFVIRDYAVGRLLYCHAPPSVAQDAAAVAAFYRETTATALQNTRKLREKVLQHQHQHQQQHYHADPTDGAESQEQNGMESNLLELLGDHHADAGLGGGTIRSSKGKVKKWAKKGRKLRNKDPYGCHSTPDEQMMGTALSGVIVKAGKYTSKGYTRATYAGARAATIGVKTDDQI
jgi:large subunit GTPase 1